MELRKTITVLSLGATVALGMTGTAIASEWPLTSERVNTGKADQADRERDASARKGPVIATYKGKKIDLGKDWGGAMVCSEYPDLSVKCFDTDAQAGADMAAYKKAHPGALPDAPPKGRADITAANTAKAEAKAETAATGQVNTKAAADCAFGWVCLYQHKNYGGRKLQWSEDGVKTLGRYNFRDRASSGCNNDEMGGADVIDYRDMMPDPELIMPLGNCYRNYDDIDYSGIGSGSWNDRADALKV